MRALPPRLDPKHDLVFKRLFSSDEEILIALLTAVLKPPSSIVSAVVQNPELPRDFAWNKRSYLDLLVRLDDGTRIDVEMQCAKRPEFRGRVLYYWAQLFASQLKSGQAYESLCPGVSILFLSYEEFAGPEFHKIFSLLEESTGEHFSPLLKLHSVELSRLDEAESTDPLRSWARFFVSRDRAELAMLSEEDVMIAKAERRLYELSADEKLRQQLLEEERRAVASRLMLSGAYHEGKAEGQLEGRRRLLEKQLELKFGSLGASVLERLAVATEEELESWGVRVLSAERLDELFSS